MSTMRGVSVALALAVVGVVPSTAQQPRHQGGHDHSMTQEGAQMMMAEQSCMTAMDVQSSNGRDVATAAILSSGPRWVRRASGPSRLGVGRRYLPAPSGEVVHAQRERVRRITSGPRVPSAIVESHHLAATQNVLEPGRRPVRRASGPSRILPR